LTFQISETEAQRRRRRKEEKVERREERGEEGEKVAEIQQIIITKQQADTKRSKHTDEDISLFSSQTRRVDKNDFVCAGNKRSGGTGGNNKNDIHFIIFSLNRRVSLVKSLQKKGHVRRLRPKQAGGNPM